MTDQHHCLHNPTDPSLYFGRGGVHLADKCIVEVKGMNFIVVFISHKTYINIEDWLTMPGAMIAYGVLGIISFIVLYCIVPETENRSLEEIEMHFSNNNNKLTHRKIARISPNHHNNGVNTVYKQNNSNSVEDKNSTNKVIIESEKL